MYATHVAGIAATSANGSIGNLDKNAQARRGKLQTQRRSTATNPKGTALDWRENISRRGSMDDGKLWEIAPDKVLGAVPTKIGKLRHIVCGTRRDTAARVGFLAPGMPAFKFSVVSDYHKRNAAIQYSSVHT